MLHFRLKLQLLTRPRPIPDHVLVSRARSTTQVIIAWTGAIPSPNVTSAVTRPDVTLTYTLLILVHRKSTSLYHLLCIYYPCLS
jgi:hypothetical protein